MATEGIDPSLLQDFLTESNELIEKLDTNLVTLEGLDEGPQQQDLLNEIFRALHTIKGAASFLALTSLTTFAHAAEDALNRLRKGEVKVTPKVMDAMLKSVDVLRGMLVQIAANEPITPAPDQLVHQLHEIVAQTAAGSAPAAAASPAPAAQPAAAPSVPANATALDLPPEKADLLEFMVADLKDAIRRVEQCLENTRKALDASEASHDLAEIGDSIAKTANFFKLDSLLAVAKILATIGARLNQVPEASLSEVYIRVEAIKILIERQAEALGKHLALTWPLDTLRQRIETLLSGQALDAAVAGSHGNNPNKLLDIDGVVPSSQGVESSVDPEAADFKSGDPIDTHDAADSTPGAAKAQAGETPTSKGSVGEQTIRVEVTRLESLMNLVGQLVLNKNRVLSLARRMREHNLPHEVKEQIAVAAGDLDQLTGELQLGVMRTRMQPLAKLFDRYPRVIRDIARMTDKKINLEIGGKETEVDKSVLEVLADPLVHILRNSADHGVETPDQRKAKGKKEIGTIRLTAEHQGSHVRVEIADDGKGLDRERIGAKGVERGLTTAELLPTLSDSEVFKFIFAPGLSTAEKVSDLSGRGVGMDVVKTNIAKINGVINIASTKGQGTTIEILIPLTVAIMPAMMVGVGRHLYAIPLTTIIEIVRPEEGMVHSVAGQPVMRLRDSVLPLLNMREKLQEIGEEPRGRFAVVVGVGQQRAGLIVDRLIGQQEIVIKPLDDRYTTGGPFSGATIREDGDVSLILDVIQLIRQAQRAERAAA